jgi:hypothetical protein
VPRRHSWRSVTKHALAQFAGREREVAAFFDLFEKGRHETASFSDEEAAAKRIERFVMDDREFFCKRHRAEFPTFMKVLEAMPVGQFAYRPHERSPSALDLVWTLANEMAACTTHDRQWRGPLGSADGAPSARGPESLSRALRSIG